MIVKYRINWKYILPRLLLAMFAAWVFTMAWISMIYVHNLLTPLCPKLETQPPGFQSITLETADGLSLQGWWNPPKNGVVVLLLGGLGSSRDSMLPDAKLLTDHDYGALTLDYRHCAGKISTLGYDEIQELQAMASFAKAQPGTEHIAVLGFSVGGAVALLGAAITPEIEAVIAEGNYANLRDEITASISMPMSLQWQIQQMVLLGFTLRTGIRPKEISPIDSISNISPRPILFIHGEKEVERTRGHLQYQEAQTTSSLWIVPDTGHGGYMQTHPQEYKQKVLGFLQDCFHD